MVTPVDPSPTRGITYFSMDKVMRYSPFCDDFGPFNLGMTHHFCMVITSSCADKTCVVTRLSTLPPLGKT